MFNVQMLWLSSILFFIINGNGVSKFGQIETYYHQIIFQDLNKTNAILQNGAILSYFASLIIHGFKIHQYKICSFIRMPSKILVGGSCQARVINNLQS